MADIAANTSTTASLTVGGAVSGTIDAGGDHDWYALTLTAGQWVVVSLTAVGFSDTYLNIRDSAGNILFYNDDQSGLNYNSQVPFQATYSGTYYIDASAYSNTATGTYQVSVQPWTPPPIATNDEIADELASGYWNGDSHHFNVTQGGSLTVDISHLSLTEQNLARTALLQWGDIIGITFKEVTSGAQITFDDSEVASGPIASTDAKWSGGVISSAQVHISSSWLSTYGSTIDSYGFQTYVHEIGHALGLGHPGNYDEDATYATNALFRNDAWSTTIMSYFDQQTDTYFAAKGFTFDYPVTPMIADILAIQKLYGLSTTTRSGDTTYGYNSNAGTVFSTLYQGTAYTIFDTGGTDTLDFSGSAAKQLLDLNPETFSNVLGGTGNLAIARGTIIENAVGGTADDIIIGNGAANQLSGGMGADTLTGGGGFDIFRDTKAGHNGDTITDFASGDHIVFTDASLSGFNYTVSGSTLTYTGGSLTLQGSIGGTWSLTAAAGGGVDLALASAAVVPGSKIAIHNDFNGDGLTDILWRNDAGTLFDWVATGDGAFASNTANFSTTVSTEWRVIGTGDFNGDGREDILWRQDVTGHLLDWLGTSTGAFVTNAQNFDSSVPANIQCLGTGDFNGDGITDVLWRNTTSGVMFDWLGNSNGGFASNTANFSTTISGEWRVIGAGDFNGDGIDDILWRQDTTGHLLDWLGTSTGAFNTNPQNFDSSVPSNIQCLGTGDFNGDGISDILWRDSNTGAMFDWLGNSNGGFASNAGNFSTIISSAWHVVSIGDVNADGKDDLIFQQDGTGRVVDWLGTASGGFVDNSAHFASSVPTTVHLQDPFF